MRSLRLLNSTIEYVTAMTHVHYHVHVVRACRHTSSHAFVTVQIWLLRTQLEIVPDTYNAALSRSIRDLY